MRRAAVEIVRCQALHDCAGLRVIAEGGNHPEAIAEDLFELRGQRRRCSSFNGNRSPVSVHG
jgi:hypothetical protein